MYTTQFTVRIRSWRILLTTLCVLTLSLPWQLPRAYAAAQSTVIANPRNDGDDNNGDDIKVYARVVSRPQNGLIGTWVIGNQSYTVTEQTAISTEHGPFEVGGCVEVEVAASSPTMARELGTEEDHKCAAPDDDNGGDDDILHFGYLQARPEGKAGAWTIGDASYTATEATELEQEHGALTVGICTKVKSPASNPTFAEEIESEQDYRCSGRGGEDGNADGMLFGLVERLPAGERSGAWVVGGQTFSATAQTEFKSEGGAFTVDSLVKVEFFSTPNDSKIAREIELESRANADGQANFGKIYATIESRPSDMGPGIWKIGGVDYLIDESTDFDDNGSDYVVGDLVEVKYLLLDNGSRRATDIEETLNNGSVVQPGLLLAVGFVESMPTTGFIGTWRIAGLDFTANLGTEFEEDDGLFAIGSYIAVEYSITNNQQIVHRLETNIPPGAGDDDNFGVLNAITNSQAAVARIEAVTDEVWTVADQNYLVTPATDLNDDGGELVIGMSVMVNSSVTDGGERVATQIRAVTMDQALFLPFSAK